MSREYTGPWAAPNPDGNPDFVDTTYADRESAYVASRVAASDRQAPARLREATRQYDRLGDAQRYHQEQIDTTTQYAESQQERIDRARARIATLDPVADARQIASIERGISRMEANIANSGRVASRHQSRAEQAETRRGWADFADVRARDEERELATLSPRERWERTTLRQLNREAEYRIYGSYGREEVDPRTGNTVVNRDDSEPGMINTIMADRRYGRTDLERGQMAAAYTTDIRRYQDSGLELTQAEILANADLEARISRVREIARRIAESGTTIPTPADIDRITREVEERDQRRSELRERVVRENDIHTLAEYEQFMDRRLRESLARRRGRLEAEPTDGEEEPEEAEVEEPRERRGSRLRRVGTFVIAAAAAVVAGYLAYKNIWAPSGRTAEAATALGGGDVAGDALKFSQEALQIRPGEGPYEAISLATGIPMDAEHLPQLREIMNSVGDQMVQAGAWYENGSSFGTNEGYHKGVYRREDLQLFVDTAKNLGFLK